MYDICRTFKPDIMNTQTISELCGHNEKAIEAMRAKWRRKVGGGFDRTHIPTDAELSLLSGPASGRKSKVKPTRTPAALKIVSGSTAYTVLPEIHGLGLPAPDNSKDTPAPKEEAPSALSGHFLRTDKFLFVTLFAAMVGQMIHTAGFFYLNSPLEDSRLRFGLAALFAIGVDCTALVMTIHRGGLFYLVSFALFHFAVNITFHSQVHENPTLGAIFGYVLLSGVLAFSNFSYTDLFSKK